MPAGSEMIGGFQDSELKARVPKSHLSIPLRREQEVKKKRKQNKLLNIMNDTNITSSRSCLNWEEKALL